MKSHSPHFVDLVTEAKKHIQEISADALNHMLQDGRPAYLIDVREDHEIATGRILNAIHISKGTIERDIGKHVPDTDAEIVVYCSGGYRSAPVAYNLQSMGYQHVVSLNKGLQGWIEQGYPLVP